MKHEQELKILFLCVANSVRSQLAEGLARELFGKKALIQSAGSFPCGIVNPFATQVLKETGIDISTQWSKSWNELPEDFLAEVDYIITLCAEETCPLFSSKAKKLHWPLLDPTSTGRTDEEQLEFFRNTRDEIQKKLLDWMQQLEMDQSS